MSILTKAVSLIFGRPVTTVRAKMVKLETMPLPEVKPNLRRTLSKSITSNFYLDDNGYQVLKERWSKLVNSDETHNLTSGHFALYAILRGKDWRKGFTKPNTIEAKSNDHAEHIMSFVSPISRIARNPSWNSVLKIFFDKHFGDILSSDVYNMIADLLPWGSDVFSGAYDLEKMEK